MSRSKPPTSFPWLVITGVLVAALSLRGPIVAPTPVLADVSADLGLSSAAAGVLTMAPVLTFAAITPMAALVVRRSGAERALLLSLSGVLIGTVIRALPGFGALLVGMVVIGAAITIGNVVIPVIIRREIASDQVAAMTALYTAMLNIGSVITSLGTAPLAAVWGWPLALLFWSVITIAGVALWLAHMVQRHRTPRPERPTAAPSPPGDLDPSTLTGPIPVLRRVRRVRPVTLLLAGAFASQNLGYYGLTTWLPTFAVDELSLEPVSAGALAAVFQGMGLVGALIIPVLAHRNGLMLPAMVVIAGWLAVVIGMLLAPPALALWLSLGAVGHAGGFVVIFTALVGAARSDAEAAGMSAIVQTFGYLVGAAGGPVVGLVYQWSGGWTVPLLVLLVAIVGFAVMLLSAVRRACA